MSGEFLMQAVVYLAAAIFCVPIAKWLGMSSVLGYLLAGVIIGPSMLDLVGHNEDIMHFAEFGVVMMLFLIGLELDPKRFWRLRRMILGLGGLQVGITALLIFGLTMILGLGWRISLAAGLALALSSTAIVLQTLKERGKMNTAYGQASFSVLLFQDIAVIPILAFLPLLAVHGPSPSDPEHAPVLSELPGWLQTISLLGAVGLIVLLGRYAVVPALRIIARTRLRELFTASALLIVCAISFLMEAVGLSPALGAFLGGVVLANSEYSHELESDLEPFKGLLLGLFFLAVGASINFGLLAANPGTILGLVLGITVLKVVVLFGLGRLFSMGTDQNLLFSIGLAQVGEFAFVLFTFMGQLQIVNEDQVSIMMAVIALSMTLTPLLMLFNERQLLPRIGTREAEDRPMDVIEEQNPVILLGFGHFGSVVGRFLRANGVEATILDYDSDRVDLLRKMGFKVYYGDATRYDLLHSAGADSAKLIISALDKPEANLRLIATVQKHFPHIELMVRARNRVEAYELIDLGQKNIYRETLDTSLRLGVDVLCKLGYRRYTATRLAQNFLKFDEQNLLRLSQVRHDREGYILRTRDFIAAQEELLRDDRQFDLAGEDHAWDSEMMRSNT